jgi:hypothetical protein
LAPRKAGVTAIGLPGISVKFSERWWPSSRQPQGALDPGAPNTVTE